MKCSDVLNHYTAVQLCLPFKPHLAEWLDGYIFQNKSKWFLKIAGFISQVTTDIWINCDNWWHLFMKIVYVTFSKKANSYVYFKDDKNHICFNPDRWKILWYPHCVTPSEGQYKIKYCAIILVLRWTIWTLQNLHSYN